MSSAIDTLIICFFVLMCACGLTGALLWIEIIGQVNAAKVAQEIPEWGTKFPAEAKRILKLHRNVFPSSKLRIIAVSINCLAIASGLTVAVLASVGNHH